MLFITVNWQYLKNYLRPVMLHVDILLNRGFEGAFKQSVDYSVKSICLDMSLRFT